MSFLDISFSEQYQEVSKIFFGRVVEKPNMYIVKLGHEQCETCEATKLHQELLGHESEDASQGCSVCYSYKAHRRTADIARFTKGIISFSQKSIT